MMSTMFRWLGQSIDPAIRKEKNAVLPFDGLPADGFGPAANVPVPVQSVC